MPPRNWSVPPAETLRLAIPGLYGYRENPHGWLNLAVPDDLRYWGGVGQEPAYTRALAENPRSHANAMESFAKVAGSQRAPFKRHAYPGLYVGCLVLLVAAWALAQSFVNKACTVLPSGVGFGLGYRCAGMSVALLGTSRAVLSVDI